MDKQEEQKILYLTLLASSVQILESFFPHPLPAARLGLANMISLLVIIKYGLKPALIVSILRTILSGLYLGTLLSISFVLSFSSAVVSTIGMYIAYLISEKTFFKLSCLGISIIGAVLHNLNQFFIVYLFFIPQKSIFLFLPILLFFAILSGTITGLISLWTTKYVNQEGKVKNNIIYTQQIFDGKKISVQSWSKFGLFFLACFFVLFTKDVFLQILVFFCFLLLHLFKKYSNPFLAIKKILWLLFFSFLIPLVFVKSGDVFFKYKFISFTKEGFLLGSIYSLRLVNIVVLSNLATNMFSKEELVLLIKKFLGTKLSKILVTGFYVLPGFIEDIRLKLKKIKSFKELPKFFAEFL